MEKTDLHPGLNAIVDLDQEGVCAAAVLNTTDHDVPITAGTRYGIIEEASVGNQQTRGLASLGRSEQQAQKMAQEAKAAGSAAKSKHIPLGKDASKCNAKERSQWLIDQFGLDKSPFLPVSYTHLTLPTIYSV